MTKPEMLIKVLGLVLVHEAGQALFLWLQFDRPTANAFTIFLVGQILYFLIPKGISWRKYSIILSGITLWYWLLMKPIFNLLEIRIGYWAFLVCFGLLMAPAIIWKIQANKQVEKNTIPEE